MDGVLSMNLPISVKSTTSRSLIVSAIDATCSTADDPEAENRSDRGGPGEEGIFNRALHDSWGADDGPVIGAHEGMLGCRGR